MTQEHSGRRIAALQGAKGLATQDILAAFARNRAADGLRVAGVVEVSECARKGGCKSFAVKDLASGETFSISQELGAGSSACNLDTTALVEACGRVEQAIDAGADVVILSKFGKAEIARSGLTDAFRAALCADIPVVTVVPEAVADEWELFAGPLAQFVEARTEALEEWWRAQ